MNRGGGVARKMPKVVRVVGPAYLDRVLRVDRPLLDRGREAAPIDRSVDGVSIAEPSDRTSLLIEADDGRLVVALDDAMRAKLPARVSIRGRLGFSGERLLEATALEDDLGGMGAGYAKALRGTLISALGGAGDPVSRRVLRLIESHGIAHLPILVEGRAADWTLLLTSGGFGDKLAIGFRGCHAAAPADCFRCADSVDLLVVASMTNAIAEAALRSSRAAARVFAPSIRNMIDADPPVAEFAECIDVLSCNRGEWDGLHDRDQVERAVKLLIVTDGPRGGVIRARGEQDAIVEIEVPAFPRRSPPRDTNRAGEAFASCMVELLFDSGWSTRNFTDDRLRRAAERAAAAAALELDMTGFGFPTNEEIDKALRDGYV